MAGLERQEVAVRVRMLGGSKFKAEADGVAGSLAKIRGEAAKPIEGFNLEKLNQGGKTFQDRIGGWNGALSTFQGKLNGASNKMHDIGRKTALLSLGTSAGIVYGIKQFAESEALFTRLETQAGATHKERLQFEKAAPNFEKFGMSVKKVSEALYPLRSDIKNGTKDIELLKAASEGASIGMENPAETARMMTSVWQNKFKDIKNPKELMGLLIKTSGEGKMTFPALMAGMDTKLPATAASYGMELRSVLGALAGASRVGLEPGMIANVFTTMLTKAITLKGGALKAAKQLGFSGQEEMVGMLKSPHGLTTLLGDLKKDVGPEKGPNFARNIKDVAEMFGMSRSYATTAVLMRTLGYNQEVTKNLEHLKGPVSEKFLDKEFAKSEHTTKKRFEQLQAKAENMLEVIGRIFAPPVLKAGEIFLGVLGGVLKAFQAAPKPVKLAIEGLIGFVAIMAPLSFALSGLFKLIALSLSPIKWAVVGFGKLYRLLKNEKTLNSAVEGWEQIYGKTGGAGGQAEKSAGKLGKLAKTLGGVALAAGVAYAAFEGLEFLSKHVFGNKEDLFHTLTGEKLDEGTKHEKQFLSHKGQAEYRREALEEYLATGKTKRALGLTEGGLKEAEHARSVELHTHVHVNGREILKSIDKIELAERVNSANREHRTRGRNG